MRRGDSDTPTPGRVSRSSSRLIEKLFDLPPRAWLRFARVHRNAIRAELENFRGRSFRAARVGVNEQAEPLRRTTESNTAASGSRPDETGPVAYSCASSGTQA